MAFNSSWAVISDKPLTEKEIETDILNYLNYYGFVCKVEMSGKPVKKANGKLVMIPFASPFYRKGFSDILFIRNSTIYFFEVKTLAEFKWYKGRASRIKKTPELMLASAKERRVKRQQEFIDGANKNGAKAMFVFSVDCVRDAIGLNL